MTQPGATQLIAQCEQWLDELIAPWVQSLGLQVLDAKAGEVKLCVPQQAQLSRVGGMMCGQAMMAAADTAMVLAACTQLGEFKPMTTVSLNTSFMRAVANTDLIVVARVLKPGKTMLFGEIEMFGAADNKLAAHATTTYALLG
jgi:uncharacterized protein (TIGR00369 family)